MVVSSGLHRSAKVRIRRINNIRSFVVFSGAVRRLLAGLLFLLACNGTVAGERVLKVAVLNHSPPMSYTDASGTLVGFNVEIMQALCDTMKVRCQAVPMPLDQVVDDVAAGNVDFAAVSLVATPARKARVAMTKPYYRSISVWFARPGVTPGALRAALVKGSVQARYAETQGWPEPLLVESHDTVVSMLADGRIAATLLPMPTALALQQDPRVQGLGLVTTVVHGAGLAGDVCLSVTPRDDALVGMLNRAIDQIKRDGRFDRINTRYIPFRLQ